MFRKYLIMGFVLLSLAISLSGYTLRQQNTPLAYNAIFWDDPEAVWK